MRVAGDTNGGLPRNQQLREVGMSFVKLDIIGRDLGRDFAGLFQALKLPCQTYKQFDVPRLSDQTVLSTADRQNLPMLLAPRLS